MRKANRPRLASSRSVDAPGGRQPRITRKVRAPVESRARVLAVAVFALACTFAGRSAGQNSTSAAPSASGSGRTVVIKIVGPGGESLYGVMSHGLNGPGSSIFTPGTTAEVSALAPRNGKTRMVWFAHEGKKLAGAVTISGDSSGPYTAKLVPWAAVTGHVMDKDKKPRAGLVFHVWVGESANMVDVDGFAHWQGPVGGDGSFRVERIVPGLTTKALILEPAISFGHPVPPLTPRPGETIDLGTLIVPTVSLPAGTKNVRAPTPPPPLELPVATFDESKANAEYKIDFRDARYDVRWLKLDAPGGAARLVQPEKKGLRFTVPAGHGQAAAVVTKFGIGGDFEITGNFEALSSVRPDIGWGMGPELLIKPFGGWDKFASAGRFLRSDATAHALVHGYKVGDEQKFDAARIPTDAKTGRFRLIRTGPTLHFQVAEGESLEFHERLATEFGTEPLEFVRISAVTGGSQKPVDVLWKDLVIRAEELPGFSAPGARPQGRARSLGWLAFAALTVVAVGMLIWWRATVRAVAPERVGTPSTKPQRTARRP